MKNILPYLATGTLLMLSPFSTLAQDAASELPRRLPTVGKLEGSSRPGDKGSWRTWTGNVKLTPRPDAATRAKELADRKAAMKIQADKIRARSANNPNPAQQKVIEATLDKMIAQYGVTDTPPRVMTLNDLNTIRSGQDSMPEGFLAAFIQFKKDLEARGVDLIVLPVAPDSAIYLHEQLPGANPQTEIWPGWNSMMLQFLENDIEIVDTLEEMRASSKDPVAVIWPNDAHTGSRGRQIMGKALAERLQRYDFARALAANREKFSYEVKTEESTDISGGNLYFSKAWDNLPEFNGKEEASLPGRTLFRFGSGEKTQWRAPKSEAMVPGLNALKKTPYQYLEVKNKFSRGDECSSLDLVMVGDSQLHSAVHGSGLPEILGAEIGGIFRWASKSWSRFDAPEIYLNALCPDTHAHPRVAVLAFLPFKFEKKEKESYQPLPLPPYNGLVKEVATAANVPPKDKPFDATLRVKAVSKQKDPSTVQYKEALTHTACVIVGGPYDGQEIGVRSWTMFDSKLLPAPGNLKVGQTLNVTLEPWDLASRNVAGISSHMVYNETNQDLLVPVFWISRGDLAPDKVLP